MSLRSLTSNDGNIWTDIKVHSVATPLVILQNGTSTTSLLTANSGNTAILTVPNTSGTIATVGGGFPSVSLTNGPSTTVLVTPNTSGASRTITIPNINDTVVTVTTVPTKQIGRVISSLAFTHGNIMTVGTHTGAWLSNLVQIINTFTLDLNGTPGFILTPSTLNAIRYTGTPTIFAEVTINASFINGGGITSLGMFVNGVQVEVASNCDNGSGSLTVTSVVQLNTNDNVSFGWRNNTLNSFVFQEMSITVKEC